MSQFTTFQDNNTITTDTNSVKCRRINCVHVVNRPSHITWHRKRSNIFQKYPADGLCNQCIELCTFVDANQTPCTKSTEFPGLCSHHSHLLSRLEQWENWKSAVEFHKLNIYVGSHWEKADEDGTIDIYHYMSREKYDEIINQTPDFDFKNFWDYDYEIWINDKLWGLCGPSGEQIVSNINYPENFREQIEAQMICS